MNALMCQLPFAKFKIAYSILTKSNIYRGFPVNAIKITGMRKIVFTFDVNI